MELFKALVLSPGTILGFIAALVVPSIFKWKPNALLWLLAVLLNLPTFQVLYLAIYHGGSWVDGSRDNLVAAPTTAIVDTLLIYFWGTGGLGLGLVLWLVLPKRLQPAGPASAIFSRSFWKARQPD